MKLEKLVPPLELCQRIPAGNFEDSALVWLDCGYLVERGDANHEIYNFVEYYPAPTLAEILIAIEDLGLFCPTCFHQSNRWAVDCEGDPVDEDIDIWPVLYDAEDNDNPATAALMLWLKLEGVKP